LIREIPHGFLIINGAVQVSPGLTRGDILPNTFGVVVEIQKGVPVARTRPRMQFLTQALLKKNLRALGDATTMRSAETVLTKGMPWTAAAQMTTAPAALCSDIDVTA